jgi:PTS system N-acetylglucosamine-specific IIC component
MTRRYRLDTLQRVGRALMLPIAVLPVAGLLLRIGQPDLLDITWMAAAGDAIFSNLGLLFAIGVAVGLARENHGAAGLAAAVCYVVATKGAEVLMSVPAEVISSVNASSADLAIAAWKSREIAKLTVPVGILSGLLAGALYNRYSEIRLPAYLAFFGGRRFVPIVSGMAGLGLAAAFGYGWGALEHGLDLASRAVLDARGFGLFAYGVLNRLLIVTGLHHIVNNIAWFLLGDFGGVTGDLRRFFAGDPQAGAFMAGFFPVMMFGLPGACLAMYHVARPERRRAVGGLLASMALTSFLTGVTEPVEFTFMFLAPVLYLVHALLTGIAMTLMDLLHVKLGFGFSAGLFDYVLNYRLATRPLWLLPVGAAWFALYYVLFRYAIVRFDLGTPGREAIEPVPAERAPADDDRSIEALVRALGGRGNLMAVDACTTRLRLEVVSQDSIDVGALARLGAHGVVRPSASTVQVVLGPQADQVAGALRQRLRKHDPEVRTTSAVESEAPSLAPLLLAALGGRQNVRTVSLASTRLRIDVEQAEQVDATAITALGLRGIAKVGPHRVHVIAGPAAPALARALTAVWEAQECPQPKRTPSSL